MAQPVTFKPSRTFTLAAFGLLVLALLGLGLFLALSWTLANPADVPQDVPGGLVSALQVVAGCVATVAGAGAGSMAARDFGSRGLTSSQAHQVLAGRTLEDPRAVQRRRAAAPAAPASSSAPEAAPSSPDGDLAGP